MRYLAFNFSIDKDLTQYPAPSRSLHKGQRMASLFSFALLLAHNQVIENLEVFTIQTEQQRSFCVQHFL